jgi:hypothetical protein
MADDMTGDLAGFEDQIDEVDSDIDALTAKYREIAAERGEPAAFALILDTVKEAVMSSPAVIAAGAVRRLARSG